MRVLFVSHDEDIHGGAYFALLDLIKSFKEYNIPVDPIVLIPNNKQGMADELDKIEIKYIIYPNWKWAFGKEKSLYKNIIKYTKVVIRQIQFMLSSYKLVKIIRKEKIDIIHSNSSVNGVGGYLHKLTHIPHIWHVREFGEEHQNYKFLFGTKFTRKLMGKMSNKIVTISDALKTKYLKYIEEDKIERIYDGLSESYINPKVDVRLEGTYNILITGTIQEGKRQLQAAEAVIALRNEGYDIELTILGAYNNSNYYRKIESKINNEKMSPYIHILGQVSNINEYRKKMDLELVCSEMEGFGRVTVEGMLSMLPIIASNSGANPEIVQNEVNGFLYEINDTNDLEKKIKILYSNRKLGIEFGQNGYNIANKKFLQKVNTKNIYKLYQEIL